MSDKLIRELLINVKQQGATKVAKNIQNVVSGLEDAAAASELTNEQLGKMPKTLYSIERAAERAAKNLQRMNVGKNFGGGAESLKKLTQIVDQLDEAFVEMMKNADANAGRVTGAIKTMENVVGRSFDRMEDSMNDTTRALRANGKAFNDTTGAANRASRAIGNTSGSSRGATRDFAAMAKIGGGLPIMYAAIASNVFVLQSAFEQLKMGDQLNRLEQFGTIVGTKTGTPVQALASSLQEAAGYAISFEEAMRQASMASAYGFDAKQLNQFGLVARRAAATLGIDMVDALNRVIKGVSKQEIELLDELGVTIRLNDAYANYVKQLNAANTGVQYNVNSLSTFQKQQAYANAVIEESTRRFGHLDQVLRATPWEQFAANADSALRKIQQAAAKYLTPVIASINAAFYTSQASISADTARAQAASNRGVDPADQGAVALSLAASEEGYNKALSMYEEALKKRDKLKKEFDKQMAESGFLGRGAVNQVMAGIPVSASTAAGTSDENKANVERMAMMGHQIENLNQEVEDSTKNLNAWKDAWQVAGEKAGKTSATFQKQIQFERRDLNDTGTIDKYNSEALKGLKEQQQAYNQTKKNAGDLANSIQNIASDTKTAGQTSQNMSDTLKTIKSLAGDNVDQANKLTKELNLGYNSYKEMETATAAIGKYVKIVGDGTAEQLAVQQKINQVYKETGDKKKAEAAGTQLELQQLNAREAALKEVLATNEGNKAIEKELQEIALEKLKTTNSQMEATKEVKDRTDKILGVDREIALLNNRTMTAAQYRLAQVKMELEIEKEKYAWYAKQGDRQNDMEQSRRRSAQLERELWQERQQQQSDMAKGREDALSLDQTRRNAQGQAEILNENISLYKDLKTVTLGNAEAQAEYTKKINESTASLAKLRAERDAQMQSMVGSSVGADYTPTTGLSGEDKDFADMQNRMASYDTAISKLSELNSEAVAVAQSMGNLSNAMIQFSQGSLDTTTLIATGMQAVASMISFGANQQVTALDAAIAAEQKRDGKSEASKNKIKKMEAEKLKIQQDAAKKQIIIQTAVAVMQAATAVPFPFSIPLMVAAGLAGALALAQASSASSMSSIADSGGDTASYLTLGERQKNVDVSMGANSGEAAYMRGDSGIGNANSFVPRAEGGNMYPGVAYKMGEHGTEIATPMVPMKVTSADDSSTASAGSSSGRPIQLNIQAMDAQSFMDFALANPNAFRKAVEASLNEQGQSLNNLR